MKGKNFKPPLVGRKAVMKNGAPVRQWLYTLDGKPQPWLTPLRYLKARENASELNTGRQYLEVVIAKIMPPYALVDHHDGQGWVRLWLDMREVNLFLIDE
jgi:hypothetical protein